MPVERYVPPTNVCVREVIQVIALRGGGSLPHDAERVVAFYYDFEGNLLAVHDPINGEPDSVRIPGEVVVPGEPTDGRPESR